MFEACQNSDIPTFYKILKEEINLDFQEESSGTTGLMVSAMNGTIEILQYLIQNGANLDLQDIFVSLSLS